MRSTSLLLLAENRPGVLARITGTIAGGGCDIVSLAAGPTSVPGHHRVAVTIAGPAAAVDRAARRLRRIVHLLEVREASRPVEMRLAWVSAGTRNRRQVLDVTSLFEAQIVEVQPDLLTIQATGEESRLDTMIEMLRAHGTVDFVRLPLPQLA